ncbi:aminotransferase class V-fold PLP-dependent enzyme [bacterium]|nr:aminotransferase class V-fold PLP-dependent enzyme [bacterium]MCI0606026.1 aminotransferase class V-fold PLP-dependent enzyme [bacterium]
MDELARYRSEFPILESTTYMISHSLGAMPRKVYDKLRSYADLWATRGIRAWAEGWWDMPVTTGNLVASLIGANPGEVVMHQNVSVAVSVILSALPYRAPKNRILYFSVDFPTVIYVLEAQKKRGAEVVSIPSAEALKVPMDSMLDAIDERTLIVSLSYVFFKNSEKVDVTAIVKKAHEMGALVLLDVYQATGTVPVDVAELDIDFLVGGSVKWLCGGPGAGYLYVKPSLYDQIEPSVTGWMAHEHPFAFQTGPIRYAPGVTRFLHGSPQIPALYAAQPGYEIINEIGVEKIRKKSLRQTEMIFQFCERYGYKTQTPREAESRGGTVVVDIPFADAILKEMTARNVLADYRPDAGIRISPHFYTLDSEIETTFEIIEEIRKTRTYEKHLQQKGSLY